MLQQAPWLVTHRVAPEKQPGRLGNERDIARHLSSRRPLKCPTVVHAARTQEGYARTMAMTTSPAAPASKSSSSTAGGWLSAAAALVAPEGGGAFRATTALLTASSAALAGYCLYEQLRFTRWRRQKDGQALPGEGDQRCSGSSRGERAHSTARLSL